MGLPGKALHHDGTKVQAQGDDVSATVMHGEFVSEVLAESCRESRTLISEPSRAHPAQPEFQEPHRPAPRRRDCIADYDQPSAAEGRNAAEKLCDVVATGHYTVTGAPRPGGAPPRAAANDGTTRTNGAGDRTRTDNLRLMKPPL